ncbi:hypothetical protein JTE90_026045 [Oedothorax gibbosus]|uniref:Uncharacterized protein n=1 Tax=Oedothorax gibbosus TaxID=931172 RepID=A0AAV6UCV3_9ARAC|nr:hypothetical protein JTE90_026045 [Oedothorax gibbosus]
MTNDAYEGASLPPFPQKYVYQSGPEQRKHVSKSSPDDPEKLSWSFTPEKFLISGFTLPSPSERPLTLFSADGSLIRTGPDPTVRYNSHNPPFPPM